MVKYNVGWVGGKIKSIRRVRRRGESEEVIVWRQIGGSGRGGSSMLYPFG